MKTCKKMDTMPAYTLVILIFDIGRNSISLTVYHGCHSSLEGGVDPELQTKAQIPPLQTESIYNLSAEATAADTKPDVGITYFRNIQWKFKVSWPRINCVSVHTSAHSMGRHETMEFIMYLFILKSTFKN